MRERILLLTTAELKPDGKVRLTIELDYTTALDFGTVGLIPPQLVELIRSSIMLEMRNTRLRMKDSGPDTKTPSLAYPLKDIP